MKKILLALFFVLTATLANATTITGFGTADTNPFTNVVGGWSYTSTLTNVSVINVSDNAFPAIYSTLTAPISILSQPYLSLTGKLDSSTPSVDHFSITLYDSNKYTAYADFTWSSFLAGTTVSKLLTNDLTSGGTFDASSLKYWSLDTFGSGQNVSFTFDNLSAVPEPSVMMLLGVSLCAFVMWRSLGRRQVNA